MSLIGKWQFFFTQPACEMYFFKILHQRPVKKWAWMSVVFIIWMQITDLNKGNDSNIEKWLFMFPSLFWGTYCFCPVCWFVRWFVCLRQTFTFTITYAILKIATWYLACMCFSWSCTFWVVKGQGQSHPSRLKVKVKGQIWQYWR